MSKTLLVLARLAPAILVSVALMISGAPVDTSGVGEASAFGGFCEPQNENGCSFTTIVCNGYNCCCVYSCSDGGTDVGPCRSTGFPDFPLAPSWAG